MADNSWYTVADPEEVVSPSLLIYPDRVRNNLEKMIAAVGDPSRLRPHIKTHKMEAVVALQLAEGITKFKCATIAEAEMLGRCEAPDVLLAMQPVGAQINRFFTLLRKFPKTRFSTLVDNPGSLEALSAACEQHQMNAGVFMDLNTGMNRTGITPGAKALALYSAIDVTPRIQGRGLHLYDGHVRDPDPLERKNTCDKGFKALLNLKHDIENMGLTVPEIVVGGSPTFPIHSKRHGVDCSPGTTVLWDERSESDLRDMEYQPAALLFCRVLSRPAPGLLCVDLGHKAVAPEMPLPRVRFLNFNPIAQISQSEEHLVLSVEEDLDLPIGSPCYAIPVHICPTVAKYPWALTVEDGRVTGKWYVTARDHVLSF